MKRSPIKRYGPLRKKAKTGIAKLENDLWKIFSIFIRLRDADYHGYCSCCSCGLNRHWREVDAGHFISRGHKYLKYDERNVHAQCKGCNAFKQGNYAGYRAFMAEKYGAETVEELEACKNWPAGFTREGLQLKITEYRNKVKELAKTKGFEIKL